MHTSCTTCALCGHACRLTRLRFVPPYASQVGGCARQAGLESKSRFSRPSPTCTSRSALLYRHAQRAMGQRSVRSGPWSSHFGVGRCWVPWVAWCHFLYKNACARARKRHFFLGSRRTGARKEGFLAGGAREKNRHFLSNSTLLYSLREIMAILKTKLRHQKVVI